MNHKIEAGCPPCPQPTHCATVDLAPLPSAHEDWIIHSPLEHETLGHGWTRLIFNQH